MKHTQSSSLFLIAVGWLACCFVFITPIGIFLSPPLIFSTIFINQIFIICGSGLVPWIWGSGMLSLVSLYWSLHLSLSFVFVWVSARVPAVSMTRRLSSFSLSKIVYGFRCRNVVLSSDHCSCYVLLVVWVLDSFFVG